MGIFDSLFNSDTKESNWPGEQLESLDQLDLIKTASFKTPQLIFKHSTRCSISRFVLTDFTAHFTYSANEFGAHYLDLLNHRDISNELAFQFKVQHQSPQILLLKNRVVVYHTSHEHIDATELKKYL